MKNARYDIPGTWVFDADASRRGYWLNQFCSSLMKADNRERFKAGERAYLADWPMTEEQREAVVARDYNQMLELGGNINFLCKIGATDGLSFQDLAVSMTGSTDEDYMKMMMAGGRPIEGARTKAEWNARG